MRLMKLPWYRAGETVPEDFVVVKTSEGEVGYLFVKFLREGVAK